MTIPDDPEFWRSHRLPGNLAACDVTRLMRPFAAALVCCAISCTGNDQPVGNSRSSVASNDSNVEPIAEARPAPSSANNAPGFPPVLLDVPDFELTDQTGAAFGAAELKGRVSIVNFIFTRCTATCPRQTARLVELQRSARRWPDWDRMRFVSISVDPARDTVAVLHDYALLNHADPTHWKFLTGTPAELLFVSKQGFKLPISDQTADATQPLTHSSRFVLVDGQLRIRGYYESEEDGEFRKLLADLRAVLSEPTGNPAEPVHVGMPADVFYTPWLDKRQAEQLKTAAALDAFHDFQFTDRTDASGIRFVNRVVADAARDFKFNHYDHGNGLAAADVDGDGLYDLYFVNQVGGNELWRNLGGGRFEDVTARAGVGLKGRVGVSASFADTDNDGDPDLFVTTTRYGNVFFVNDGTGRFRDVTAESGLEYTGHSSSADFFDYDRDGLLDLFVTNVGVFTTNDIGHNVGPDDQKYPYYIGAAVAFGAHLIPARSERSILYHNDGSNTFHDASVEAGLVHKGWSGDAVPLDANDDGWPDLYVLNMQGNDEYYENDGSGKFNRHSQKSFPRIVWGGMGCKSLDYNNDGKMELFVTNMHADMWKDSSRFVWNDSDWLEEKSKAPDHVMPASYLNGRALGKNILGNAVYEIQEQGRFLDVSDQINAEMLWPWGLSAGDLNADGFEDVFITSSMNLNYRYHPNSLLLNERGRRFADAEFILGVEPRKGGQTAAPWFELDCSGGDAGHELSKGRSGRLIAWGALGSRSSVLFDLDGDGDLDIVTNDFNSPPLVLISDLSERNPNLRFLKVLLRGGRSNRDGLGTRVEVTAGGQVLTRVHDGQSGYLSQSSLPLYFGLGSAETIDKISALWPGGTRQVLEGPIAANQQLVILEEP